MCMYRCVQYISVGILIGGAFRKILEPASVKLRMGKYGRRCLKKKTQ